jgi:hypothetical protein
MAKSSKSQTQTSEKRANSLHSKILINKMITEAAGSSKMLRSGNFLPNHSKKFFILGWTLTKK